VSVFHASVDVNAGHAGLFIERLPLWQGVQGAPGIRHVFPFRLGCETGLGLIRQTTDQWIVDKVIEAYASDEYELVTAPPGSSDWANYLGDRYFEAIVAALDDTLPESVLEIGSGSLYLAERMLERFGSRRYTAVDPALESASGRIEVIGDYFPSAALSGRKYQLVFSLRCLEHVPDPVSFLRGIGEVLEPGGKVVLIYPDCGPALSRGDLNVLLHEHLSYFTHSTSRRIAERCGFRVDSLESKGEAFCLVLSKGDAGTSGDKPATVADEEAFLARAVEAFERNLAEKERLLRSRLEAGERVAFHGATNGLNNFLFLTGLAESFQVGIFDGDATKAGKYLPACREPIRHASVPAYRDSDLLVVSAVTFYEPIRRFACVEQGLSEDRILAL